MSADSRIERVKNALLAMQRYQWEQGTAAQAMLELGESDLAVLMAKDAVVRQSEDGRLGVMGDNVTVTDPAANGEAVLFAAKKTGDSNLEQAASRMLTYLMKDAPRSGNGTLYHLAAENQVWVDSFYMAPPFLAACGEYQEAVKQIEGFRGFLWNNDAGLFSHIWDDDRGDYKRKDHWGVGNGWAAAGITRVVSMLPRSMENDRVRLIGYVQQVLDGCLEYIREDGLFHNVVDDSSTFVETNLSQMLSYTIFRGVAAGWIDGSYLTVAEKMRRAVHQKVDEFGLVRDVCGAPTFDSPGTAPEGNAFFLLMEAAARDLRTSFS